MAEDTLLEPEDAAEELALTVCLAWLVEEEALGPEVLVPLQECVERALRQIAEEG